MTTRFSHSNNANFIDAILPQDLLDVAVVWIGDNLEPDDVFSTDQLEEWALEDGWSRAEE